MAFKRPPADMLKKHNKDSLLIAQWVGLPLGWITFLICVIVYFTVGIHDDTAPPPAFFICIFIFGGVGLSVSHRAVARELRNRQDEPSNFVKTLGKMILLIVAGLIFFLAVFFGSQFVLTQATSIEAETILDVGAVISLGLLLVAFTILAIRWARRA